MKTRPPSSWEIAKPTGLDCRMVRRFLLEQRLTDRRIAQVIEPIVQVLLCDAAGLLLPAGVAAIERAYPKVGDLRTVRVTSRDGNGQWGGRVTGITLTGSAGSVRVSGDAFRAAFGLRSTWFTLRKG